MNTATAPPVFDRLNTLGDPTRSRILAVLEEHELTVTELRKALQLPQSTVSRHLRILADAGWVRSRAEGTSHFYRVEPELTADARELWSLVAQELGSTTVAERDRERASSVLLGREERVRAFFSRSAEGWDELRDGMYGARAELLPLFGLLDPDAVVADLGCGTGSFAGTVAPFVRRVIGVDRAPEMIAEATRRLGPLAADDGPIELREGSLGRLPVEDAEADVAVLSLVLHYVADPARALAEARRILRPGGRLVIVDMRRHERSEYGESMGHLWPGFEEEELEGWLEAAGFERAMVRPLRPDPDAEGPLLFVATAVAGSEAVAGSAAEDANGST